MKKIILIILIVIFAKKADCQVFGNIIERNIQSTVLVKIGTGSGSGLLVQDSMKIYLITAKHVIFDANQGFKKLNSRIAEIQFYAKDFRGDSANQILIDLKNLIKNKLIIVDSLTDICVLRIADVEPSGAIKYTSGVYRIGHGVNYTPYFLHEKTVIEKKDLFLGEDVFVIGFPTSIGLQKSPQFDYEKPLLKRGAIASISDGFNTFVIDCPVYHGNSGGPVFLERKGFDDYKLRLIGIVTQFIPLINQTASKKDLTVQHSSYAVVVPIDYALDLINE